MVLGFLKILAVSPRILSVTRIIFQCNFSYAYVTEKMRQIFQDTYRRRCFCFNLDAYFLDLSHPNRQRVFFFFFGRRE